MSAEEAIKLLRTVGLYGLCGYDGCLCGECSIQGFHISVSCRKGEGLCRNVVRVVGGDWPNGLKAVAQEVVAQVHKEEPHTPIVLRYCSYHHDHDQKCVYCEQPREDESGYLCSRCLTRVAENCDPFDYRKIEFEMPALDE